MPCCYEVVSFPRLHQLILFIYRDNGEPTAAQKEVRIELHTLEEKQLKNMKGRGVASTTW